MRLPLLAVLLAAAPAFGQGFPPAEAARRVALPPGFTARAVAHEPTIRQPLSAEFDERGRLWVLQFLQYPNPEGMKPVSRDQFLRTVWDKLPEPPPRGPRGADRLTILSDPGPDGVYQKAVDFVGGLNLASGFCLGRGGVFVAQPPYLLFYPDRDRDDRPDADPDVLLAGFGLDDTHSLANSLRWGPDGWLYGAAGSTSTSRVRNPAAPGSAPIEFQQGVWRYHPPTRAFELFSEGGGNTYGLDFDRHGQLITGTNFGGFAMLHQHPGAYHVKGFAKHGPLHNPFAFGYFGHVPCPDFRGGHVTCGGIVYEGDAYPEAFRGRYLAGNLLSNALYWYELTPDGSTFRSRHGGTLADAKDTWFRPVDLIHGPDGSVFAVDFTDRRAAHLDPVDDWDKTNGRVFKIEYEGTKPVAPFDLGAAPGPELLDRLTHRNVWWRDAARRQLADRPDAALVPELRRRVRDGAGADALDALWALHAAGGCDEAFLVETGLSHPFEHVRAWSVRLLSDFPSAAPAVAAALRKAAETDASVHVRCQLACAAKRLRPADGLSVAGALFARGADDADPCVPMLLWWAFEAHADADPAGLTRALLAARPRWESPTGRLILERVARRHVASERQPLGELLALALAGGLEPLLAGIDLALQGKPARPLPADLAARLRAAAGPNPPARLATVLVRLGDPTARGDALKRLDDAARPDAARAADLALLAAARAPELAERLPRLLSEARSDALKLAALDALGAAGDPAAGPLLLAAYPNASTAVKNRVVALLTSRPTWGKLLLEAADDGRFPRADLSPDAVRPLVQLGDAELTKAVEKRWGRVAPATAGEKAARIASLAAMLKQEGHGDAARGKALFARHCAACHTLFGEGGNVGPDLTAADRKNAGYLLAQIVDPSGYVRPEYVAHRVDTADGRSFTGLLSESGETLAVTDVADGRPRRTELPKRDVDAVTPLPTSLMPEKLLDALPAAEVRDLFAHLMSLAPR